MSQTDQAMQLFPDERDQAPVTAPGQTHATGILPAHGIRNMIREQQIGPWRCAGRPDTAGLPGFAAWGYGLPHSRQLPARPGGSSHVQAG